MSERGKMPEDGDDPRWASKHLDRLPTTGRFDVVGTTIATGARRLIAKDENRREAEAIMFMAVMRRGVDVEVFSVEEHPAPLSAAEERR